MATGTCLAVALVLGVHWPYCRQVHYLPPLPQLPVQAAYVPAAFLTGNRAVRHYLIGNTCHLEGVAPVPGLSARPFARFLPQALCSPVLVFGRRDGAGVAVFGVFEHPDLLFEVGYFTLELFYEQPLFFDNVP